MKFHHILAALPMGFLLIACNSLDNPFLGLRNLGHDSRAYDPITGRYEWPDDSGQHRKQQRRTSEVASAMSDTPAPAKKGDGRYYDPVKGKFVQEDEEPPAPRKPKATPHPAVARVTPEPAPEKPAHVYNMNPGTFDWSPSGAPPAKTPPADASESSPPPAPSGPSAPLFPQ